jgi:hypothetical protein
MLYMRTEGHRENVILLASYQASVLHAVNVRHVILYLKDDKCLAWSATKGLQ